MKNFSAKLFVTAVATFLSICASYAQDYAVKAKILDSITSEPVAYATASFTPEGSQKALKYVLTTDEGDVLVDRLRKGKYTMKVEMLGYQNLTLSFNYEGGKKDLGKLKFEPDSKMLDAAKVTDLGNPITIKKDTIEYNATIFKTSENDMLIDLLKKLPGIEVDSNGSITANGKEIKKITIEGKTFFLDDPQLATQNIPSKIVEKVKVVDRKSEQAQFTGIDDGEEETIIDLGIKKGMMDGWFGNFMAGGGHDVPSKNNSMNDWRWQGAGFSGNFKEKSQIGIILNGNNTNNRGFNDLAGSMMGNMRGGGRGGWGNNDGGITTSWMGGVNGSWDLCDDRMELAGNYLYNGSSKLVEENALKNTYENENETLNYKTDSKNSTFANGHRFGVRLDHKFNNNTSIFFEPQFNFGNGNYTTDENFDTRRSFTESGRDTVKVNDGYSRTDGVNRNWNASGRILLRQRLGKAGRTMTLNMRYNLSNNLMDGNINNLTTNYAQSPSDPKEFIIESEEIVNQFFNQKQFSTSLTAGATYTEPLYKENLFMEVNYNYTWSMQDSYKNTYDRATGVLDEDYSNTIYNEAHNHRAGVNLMWQQKGLSVQLGVNANPTTTTNRTENGNSKIDTTYTTMRWSPQASIRYDASDNSNLRINYWGRSNQPSTSQLMPVKDNSDPLNVSLGNPYLLPYFNHNIRGSYRYSQKKSFLSFNTFFGGGVTQSPIVNTSWYENGRQFSLPTNGPDSYNANIRAMLNAPLGKSNFSIFTMVYAGFNHSANYVKTGDLDMNEYYKDGSFDYAKFHKEMFTDGKWDKNFSTNKNNTLNLTGRFRLTFRNELVEVNAGIRERVNKGWYSISQANQNATYNTSVETSMNWTIPGGVGLNAEYRYDRYDGYTTPQNDAHVLNAEITKQLWKNRFTLALKGYDLLGMSRNLAVNDTANYHSETVNNTLGRYVVLSLTYRFGKFNKDNMRGPGGRGGNGGGRGPMGPPPGRF